MLVTQFPELALDPPYTHSKVEYKIQRLTCKLKIELAKVFYFVDDYSQAIWHFLQALNASYYTKMNFLEKVSLKKLRARFRMDFHEKVSLKN